MNKWVYLAGLIDGDGSIFISERGKTSRGGHGYYRLIVSVANCNQTLLRWLERPFDKTYVGWDSDNYYAGRVAWEGPAAKYMARKLLPFLVAKKQQAKLALRFPFLGRGAPGIKRSDISKYHTQGRKLFEKMSALNAKWSMGKVRGARKKG